MESEWFTGPELSDDLEASIRAALDSAYERLSLGEVPKHLDHAAATDALERVWEALRGAGENALSGAEIYRLHALSRSLAEVATDRCVQANETLARVLNRLEAAPCVVADLIRLIPELICELGFSRALISRVEGNLWLAELMYVVGDQAWAEELTQIGQGQAQTLSPGLFETELVRTQRSIIATRVQEEVWRSHAHLAPAAKTESYVAAPIVSDGEVIGILHAERYLQRRHVDETDRQTLTIFAEAVRIALSRAALAEALAAAEASLASVVKAVDGAVGAVHRIPPLHASREPEEGQGMVVRYGPGGAPRPLPGDLSRRELEVLRLMAAGKSNGAIARTLVIAEGTVKQHVKHILRKLMVGSRAEAVTRWYQSGAE